MRFIIVLLFSMISFSLYADDRICETQDQKAWITCQSVGFFRRGCVFEFKNSRGGESRLKDLVDSSTDHVIAEDRIERVCDFVGSKYAFDRELNSCLYSLLTDERCVAPDAD